jgi:excisionase family DNA binding protein
MMKTKDPARVTCTIPEAAKKLGIGRNSAYKAATNGELPTVRFGNRLVVPLVALDRILEAAR